MITASRNLKNPFGALDYELCGYSQCDKNEERKQKVLAAVAAIKAEMTKDITKAPEILFKHMQSGETEHMRRQFTSDEAELDMPPEYIAADLIRAALRTTKPLSQVKAAVYCRVGSAEQLAEETSVRPTAIYVRVADSNKETFESQSQQLRKFIQQNPKLQFVKQYTDNGNSGHGMERNALKRLRSAIAQGKIKTVVATDASRISRNVADMKCFLMDCYMRGVEVLFTDGTKAEDIRKTITNATTAEQMIKAMAHNATPAYEDSDNVETEGEGQSFLG